MTTTQTELWEQYDEIRQEVEVELEQLDDVPGRVLRMSGIYTKLPKDGTVFTYPDSIYFELTEDMIDHADTIESLLSEHVEIERNESTFRTDGITDRVWFVVQE